MYLDNLTTTPKSLRVQSSLALQACSLLTTKQFNHLHYSIVDQEKTLA